MEQEKITINDIDKRLSSIEEVLKMLVVNSLINDIDKERVQQDRYELNEEFNEIVDFLSQYKLTIGRTDETNGFTLVYVFTNPKQKFKTKDYLLINQKLVNTFEHVVPVFCFDTLNGMQRKRFIEESISFQITGKETFICAK